MKKLALISVILFLAEAVFAQAGGNIIYEQNNRYKQNTHYNKGAELVYNNRIDNFYRQQKSNNQNREMFFTVNALMNVKADSYLAIFSMVQTGKTEEEADVILNKKIEGFKTKVAESGIPSEDIFTDMISLVPVYEIETEKRLFSKTYTEVPAGFEMQKNLHVRYNDERMLEKIITAAAQNEIYDLIKVEYFVKNNAAKYEQLRAKTITFMKKKLEDFRQLGIRLDTVYHIISEKSSVQYPVDRYQSYQAFSGTSIQALNNKHVSKVKKPKVMFYNKLPYHLYDIVINPEILEPPVQFTYSITLKYIVEKEAPKIQKEYIMLTPGGTVKSLGIHK